MKRKALQLVLVALITLCAASLPSPVSASGCCDGCYNAWAVNCPANCQAQGAPTSCVGSECDTNCYYQCEMTYYACSSGCERYYSESCIY